MEQKELAARMCKEVREFLNLSQRELANILGYKAASAVSAMERAKGVRVFSLGDLTKIEDEHGVRLPGAVKVLESGKYDENWSERTITPVTVDDLKSEKVKDIDPINHVISVEISKLAEDIIAMGESPEAAIFQMTKRRLQDYHDWLKRETAI